MATSTIVTEFLLLGPPGAWKVSFLYFLVFPPTYLGTSLGNLVIIAVTTAGQNLRTPMYFFFRNLSIWTCATFPSLSPMLVSTLSLATGPFQWLVVQPRSSWSCVELLFLCIIAWDHNVAICQPLQSTPQSRTPGLCPHDPDFPAQWSLVLRCARWRHISAVLLSVKHSPPVLL